MQINVTLSSTASYTLGIPITCNGASSGLTTGARAYTALVVLNLPSAGSPVTIDTCGSVVDTIMAGAY